MRGPAEPEAEAAKSGTEPEGRTVQEVAHAGPVDLQSLKKTNVDV